MERMAGPQFQKMIFRGLGGAVSTLFALQAVWVFLNPPEANLWKLCHWIGQAFLCLFAGAAGCYLEVKGGRALLDDRLAKFTANRVLLSLFYFWLGCYIMDMSNYNSWQVTLAHLTGLLAWAVSIGDLVVSCACEGAAGVHKQGGEDANAQADQGAQPAREKTPAAAAAGHVSGAEVSVVDLEQGQGQQLAAPAGGGNPSWTHKDAQAGTAAPVGGWSGARTDSEPSEAK